MDALIRAVHQGVVLLFGKSFDRSKYIKAKMFCNSSKMLAPVAVKIVPVNSNCSVSNAQAFIRNYEVRVKFHLKPEPIAGFASPERTVERKHPGLEFLKSHPADRTCHVRRVKMVFSFRIHSNQESGGFLKCIFTGFDKP